MSNVAKAADTTLAESARALALRKEAIQSPGRRAWRRFRHHRMALIGLSIVGLVVTLVVFAPLFTPYNPDMQDIPNRLKAPTLQHPMGTDELGRDEFARVLYGGRISLVIGVVAMAIGVSVGTLLGAISGYFGGWVDSVIMRFVDIVVSFPSLFLLIMLASLFRTSVLTVILVIGFFSWMRVARLVRASFVSLKARDFVMAARALGCGPRRIILSHLLPNSLAPIIVAGTIDISAAILTESALSYLGLGVQPPQATWGNMLRFAQDQMASAPWTAIFPGLMILLVSIGINFVGDGLRDAFDPRTTS